MSFQFSKTGLKPEPSRDGMMGMTPMAGPGEPGVPEREWGLSAGQVVAVVLAIVVLCEVIGLLG